MSVNQESGEPKQAPSCEAGVDRISKLPPTVTQRILECLPLDYAVRTSVLSQYWRYKWVHLPQLILDHPFFLKVLTSRWGVRSQCSDESHAYTNVVNHILVRHIRPIRKFVLFTPCWVPASIEIGHWIEFVGANGIKELTLENDHCSRMNLPSSLFLCAGLTHLELYNLQIYLFPPTFTGFTCLTELQMHIIMTTDSDAKAFETLISSCPQLENLNLNVVQETEFTICAQKLQDLVVKGFVTGIDLKGTTRLRTVSISTWYDWSLIALYEFLCCLPNVEILHLETEGLEDCLHNSQETPKFPNDFRQLTSLKLEIEVNCLSAMSLALRIVESSPHLQQLAIEVSIDLCEQCGDTSLHIKEICNLHSLKNVAVVGIMGLSNHLNLIKLLLGCSPALDVMTIELNEIIKGAELKLNIARELMLYPRASSKAKIIFKS